MTFLLILFGALEGLIKKKFELRRVLALMRHGRAIFRPIFRPKTLLGCFLSQRHTLTPPFFRLQNPGDANHEKGTHGPADSHPRSG